MIDRLQDNGIAALVHDVAGNIPIYAGRTDEAYITMLRPPTAGFRVKIPRPNGSGAVIARNFKGSSRSLEEHFALAKGWRDQTYLRLYGEPPPCRVFHARQANSATGVAGVRFVVKKVRSRQRPDVFHEVPVYLAEVWLEPGQDRKRPRRSRSRLFSIAKYGNDKAFELAVAWRTQAEQALKYGQPP